MTDVGTHITLPSRSLVRSPVNHRMNARAANASLGAAGADETEADPPQGVAVVPFLVDTERDSSYGDAMSDAGDDQA